MSESEITRDLAALTVKSVPGAEESRPSPEIVTGDQPGAEHLRAQRNYSGANTDGRLVELWLHGKSAATKEVYLSAYAAFLNFSSNKPLIQVTLADVQEFSDDLEEPFAPSTRAKILAAIKSLVSFGHQVGYLPFDVGKGVRLPKRRDGLSERILTADDVHSMIAEAKGPQKRDKILLRTLYIGGLRVAEAVALRTRDLKTRPGSQIGAEAKTEICNGSSSGQITLFGKGGKTRRVLLPGGLYEELEALSLPESDAPIFRSRKKSPGREPQPIGVRQAERIVKAAAKKAGVGNAQEVSPHWLRHAHASHAMDRGAKVHLVQATLGHASVATTGKYLHARPDDSSALYLGS